MRYEGSNPSLCTSVEPFGRREAERSEALSLRAKSRALSEGTREMIVNRLLLAFAAYVALGILSWMTLSEQRIRVAALVILAMFAFRTWVRRKDVLHPEENGEE